MKKLISAAMAAVISAASLSAITGSVSAQDDSLYLPKLYLRASEGQNFVTDKDGTLVFTRDSLGKGITVSVDVFIEDDSLTCWSIAPKIKCRQKLISMENAYDPLPNDGSPYLMYAYAETDSSGKLICDRHETYLTIDKDYNVVNYTLEKQRTLSDSSPLVPYGKTSDEYPILTFEMEISPNTPYGTHDVYFLTKPEDEHDQRCTTVAMRVNGSTVVTPETEGIKIRVNGSNRGDINNDGKIDASDASLALICYSKSSVHQPLDITDLQFEAGDIDGNGKIDASDASFILVYYSYASTTSGDVLSFTEHYNLNRK